jgi:hypothetical protein
LLRVMQRLGRTGSFVEGHAASREDGELGGSFRLSLACKLWSLRGGRLPAPHARAGPLLPGPALVGSTHSVSAVVAEGLAPPPLPPSYLGCS